MSLPSAKKLMLGGRRKSSGQDTFTTPGTFQWKCPANVTSVCVVAVGGGHRGGAGLGWRNDIAVVPGREYLVVVGGRGDSGLSGDTYFISPDTVCGRSGADTYGGSFAGDGGGVGGAPGSPRAANVGGGGGAGGYYGAGGAGGDYGTGNGGDGSGGGGGGAGGGNSGYTSPPGGGVGLLGVGASGKGGKVGPPPEIGGNGSESGLAFYGRGCGGGPFGNAGIGALRIIFGKGRAFPSTRTEDV